MHRTMDARRSDTVPAPRLAASETVWLTVDQAIAFSGIKRDSLYRLIREGRVRSTKIGERRLILRQSLLELDRAPA